ncbi:MAG: hypothetical protein M3Z56_04635 [Bacteroidota bacterium]|nr:hypothetical protein [Bacteroidota bacterium]
MTTKVKYKVIKILTVLMWVTLGSGIIVLLVAAITKKNNEHCVKTEISISGVQNNFFIDKNDVLEILKRTNGGKLENKPIQQIDLASMENALRKDQWIRKAELFFDNNDVLHVKISEREPIARIFTSSGSSFYMDSSLKRLPLSDKFSARLPVFTNFPADVIVLSKKDSNLLRQIKTLSEFIEADPFWMAQIDQLDITSTGTFALIPKVGNQVIDFGDTDDYRQKFRNLLTFYKQIEVKSGWNMYSVIDVKYKGQVIGVKRGAQEIKMDSLRTIQIMKSIIANAQKRTNDSTNIQLVQPADDNNSINAPKEFETVPAEDISIGDSSVHVSVKKPATEPGSQTNKDALKTEPSSFEKPVPVPVKKPISKPPSSEQSKMIKQKPKAVMPPKGDY